MPLKSVYDLLKKHKPLLTKEEQELNEWMRQVIEEDRLEEDGPIPDEEEEGI